MKPKHWYENGFLDYILRKTETSCTVLSLSALQITVARLNFNINAKFILLSI